MKHFNKYFLVFLTLSAFALNSMEEQTDEAKGQKIEPLSENFQPLSCKAQAARTISRIMTTGKLSPEYLSSLPQELKRFVGLFNAVDSVMARKAKLYEHTIEYNDLVKYISETSELLYRLIDSGSEHTLRFIAALDDFFYSVNKRNYFKLTEGENIKDVLATINMFAKIILDPQNAELIIDHCRDMLICSDCDNEGCISIVALRAVNHNLVCFIYFLLELNLIRYRRYQLELFDNAFYRSIPNMVLVKLLKYKINITKHEFELMLNVDRNILWQFTEGTLDIVKYLFKLIKIFELDLRQIINKQYYGETLLHKAVYDCNAGIVKFLVAYGADISIQARTGNDLISYALKRYNYLVQDCINVDDKNRVDIAHKLLNISLIIEFLRATSNEKNQN